MTCATASLCFKYGRSSWAWKMERCRKGRLEKLIENRWKKKKSGNRATGGKQGVVIFQEYDLLRRNIWETDLLRMLTVWMLTGITPKLLRRWKFFPCWGCFSGTLGNSSFLLRYLCSKATSCSQQLLARLLIPPGRSSLPSCPHLPSMYLAIISLNAHKSRCSLCGRIQPAYTALGTQAHSIKGLIPVNKPIKRSEIMPPTKPSNAAESHWLY